MALVANGTTLASSELATLDGVTAGTATASKVLIVDSSKDITLGTGDLTATTATLTGTVTVAGGSSARYEVGGRGALEGDTGGSLLKLGTGYSSCQLEKTKFMGGVGVTVVASTYHNNADDFVIYESSAPGMTIAGGANNVGRIFFADASGDSAAGGWAGYIDYSHSSNAMSFGTNNIERIKVDIDGHTHWQKGVADDTNKQTYFISSQYDSGSETEGWRPLAFYSASGVNKVSIGGGGGSYNAATEIEFFAAANETTRTGTEVLSLTSSSATFGGEVTLSSHLNMGDGDIIKLGNTAEDFEIFHSGVNIIRGTQGLVLQTDDTSYGIQMGTHSGGETMFKALKNGAVTLYHDNAVKFATTSAGISVTGEGTFTGNVKLNGSTNPTLELDAPSGERPIISFDSSDATEGHIYFQQGSATKSYIQGGVTGNEAITFFTGGTTQALKLDSSQNATFAGRVGIDSGGYTQQQLHVGDLGTLLLSHGTDTVGEYAGIFMRAEGDEENGMLRTKGLIAFERTGAYGVGDMKFCILGDANNSAVTNSNVVLKLDSSSNATFAGSGQFGTTLYAEGNIQTSDNLIVSTSGQTDYAIDNNGGAFRVYRVGSGAALACDASLNTILYGTLLHQGNYITIDNTAQNGIKIYGNDTACHYIYDKADGSLSGGLTWGHADAEFHVYTNGVSTNSQALKITADNTATFAGDMTLSHAKTLKWTTHGGSSGSRSWAFVNGSPSDNYFYLKSSDADDNTLDRNVIIFENTGATTFEGNITGEKAVTVKGSAWNDMLYLGDGSASKQTVSFTTGTTSFGVRTGNSSSKGVISAYHDGSIVHWGSDYTTNSFAGNVYITPPNSSGNATTVFNIGVGNDTNSNSSGTKHITQLQMEATFPLGDNPNPYTMGQIEVGSTAQAWTAAYMQFAVGGSEALVLYGNKNATFSGDVTITSTNKLTIGNSDEDEERFRIANASSGSLIMYAGAQAANYNADTTWAGVVTIGTRGGAGSGVGWKSLKTAGGCALAVTAGNVCIGDDQGYQKLTVSGGNIYLSPGYDITWANGNAVIGESGYALEFDTYNGSALTRALTLAGDNSATFAGTINSTRGSFGVADDASYALKANGNVYFSGNNTYLYTTGVNVNGTLNVTGTLNATGTKNFRIPHPLPSKKDTHDLLHVSIEAPKADLIYRGKVQLEDGSATVNIDTHAGMTEGTFVLLCDDVQCFTTNESDWDEVKGSVSENILTIQCKNSSATATISWMVIGERNDDDIKNAFTTDINGKVIVEPVKAIIED